MGTGTGSVARAGVEEVEERVEVRNGKPWYELWGTYAVAFLLVVSVALYLPTGPRQLGISIDAYVLLHAVLGFLAVASAILGGIAFFRKH